MRGGSIRKSNHDVDDFVSKLERKITQKRLEKDAVQLTDEQQKEDTELEDKRAQVDIADEELKLLKVLQEASGTKLKTDDFK